MSTKRGVVAHNMPKDAVFLDSLPQHIIKKEAEMDQKFRDPIKLDSYSFVLGISLII